jgi:DNA-directed RNA polymerase specialized sigma24 family protein
VEGSGKFLEVFGIPVGGVETYLQEQREQLSELEGL